MTPPLSPDLQVAYHGPAAVVTIVSDRAQAWWSQNVLPGNGWRRQGCLATAEFPRAWPVLSDAREAGLEVTL